MGLNTNIEPLRNVIDELEYSKTKSNEIRVTLSKFKFND